MLLLLLLIEARLLLCFVFLLLMLACLHMPLLLLLTLCSLDCSLEKNVPLVVGSSLLENNISCSSYLTCI